jgi:hypothetical protein
LDADAAQGKRRRRKTQSQNRVENVETSAE